MKKMRIIFLFGMLLLGAQTAHAYTQILISEIMYDVPGADSGHEWIEVQNTGDTSINFTKWKLFEGSEKQTNHGIKQYKGNDIFPAGAHAVIASNGDTFLADHPGYAGAVFTSSFSLSNDGETIGIKDATLAIVHQVSYDKSVGAAGDGSSLQKISDTWHVAVPTPGGENAATNTLIESSDQLVAPHVEGSIHVLGELLAGETITFTPQFSTMPIGPVNWNFGDGTTLALDTILPTEYTFSFPGTYTVILADADGQHIAETVVVIGEKPVLVESIEILSTDTPTIVTEVDTTITDITTDTSSALSAQDNTSVPLAANAASAGTKLSTWLVGLGTLVALAVLCLRMLRKPKSEFVQPDDGIELID